MGMFDNYSNLSSSYVPNNQEKEIVVDKVYDNKLPKKEYNHKGVFIGYSWNYGDTVTIPYSINKTVKVEEDALIYIDHNQKPSTDTVGILGQKAYNTLDLKCWVCETLDQNVYKWVEQAKFVYPSDGTKEIVLINDLGDKPKTIRFTLVNFRKEEVYSTETNGSTSAFITIDEELSRKLIKGIYYANFSIVDGDSYRNDESFLILVKDEYKAYEIDGSSAQAQKTIEELIADAVAEYIDTHPIKILVDDHLDSDSENPVQNKVLTNRIVSIDTSISDLSLSVSEILDSISDINENLEQVFDELSLLQNRVSSVESNLASLSNSVYEGFQSVSERFLSVEDEMSLKPNSSDISDVGFSGEYSDLKNKPSLEGYATKNYVIDADNSVKEYADAEIGSVSERVLKIESVIPEQTYTKPSNELADKDFVNSSIENVAAYYITSNQIGDSFPYIEALRGLTTVYSGGVVRIPTKNDYCVVAADATKGKEVNDWEHFTTKEEYIGYYIEVSASSPRCKVTHELIDEVQLIPGVTIAYLEDRPTTRYIYMPQDGETGYNTSRWQFQYIVNNSGFTSDQWKSINSGITDVKVEEYDEHIDNSNIHLSEQDRKEFENLENIKVADLRALVDANNLVRGKKYRITNYECTSNTLDTRVISHPFDIVVTALSTNVLDENASALPKDNDTYYVGKDNITSWELKYYLFDDKSRFDWSDEENGKGVIYYMKDSHNNECPYDFKQIQFKRSNKWLYTFGGETDASVVSASTCYSNVIRSYFSSNNLRLNNIVFNGSDCYSNTFGSDCYSNTFGNNCCYNTFGNYCYSNTFGYGCYSNTFGNYCNSNTFGNSCCYNTFGNRFNSNTFGNNCYNNTFGNYCNSNTFGYSCTSNTFGSNCKYIKVGTQSDIHDYLQQTTVGDYCSYLYLQTSNSARKNNNILSSVTGTPSSYITVVLPNSTVPKEIGMYSNKEIYIKENCGYITQAEMDALINEIIN